MATKAILSRRRFLSLTSLTLAGAALGACAPATPTQPAAQPTEQPTEEAPKPTPTVALQVQEIRLAHWWPADMFTPIIARFNEIHPAIQIEEQALPWDAFHDKLLTQVAAGTAPEVTLTDSGYFVQLIAAGVFLDITDLLEGDKDIDPTKWSLDPAIDSGYKGRAYGMPFGLPDSMNIIVQRDLFDEAGISVPEHGEPDFMTWDWAKFLEVAQALTKVTSDGTVEQWGVAGPGPNVDCYQRDMVWTNGGEFFDDPTCIEPTEAKFTEPEFIEAWQWVVDLELVHGVTLSQAQNAAVFADQWSFMSGKVAMTWNWNGYDWYTGAEFPWAWIAPPYEKRVVNKYGGNSWFIPASTPEDIVPASWEWLKWATTSEEGTKMFLVGGLSSYWPDRMMPYAAEEAQRKLWALLIEKAAKAVEDGGARPYGFGVHASEITDTLNAENDLIYSGDQTVEEGMQKAKEKVDVILAGA